MIKKILFILTLISMFSVSVYSEYKFEDQYTEEYDVFGIYLLYDKNHYDSFCKIPNVDRHSSDKYDFKYSRNYMMCVFTEATFSSSELSFYEQELKLRNSSSDEVPTKSDYKRTDYSPGMLISHKFMGKANYISGYPIEITCPMYNKFYESIWNDCDKYICEKAKTGKYNIYIASGPVIKGMKVTESESSYEYPVPESYYKFVAYIKKADDYDYESNKKLEYSYECFIIPHKNEITKFEPNKYKVSLFELEKLGMVRFSDIIRKIGIYRYN